MVIQCVSSVNFSILINDKPGKEFKPMRGLRQGNPLSPYLFLIVSEVLLLLMQNAADMCILEGIKISSNGPCISHLLFADDTLIFLNANRNNYTNVVKLLEAYCHASRKEVSLKKSTVFLVLTPRRCYVRNYAPF